MGITKSLQFTEKLFKGAIADTGNKFEYNHNLVNLAYQLGDVTGIVIDTKVVETINRKTDVRYSASLVTSIEELEAHLASLNVLHCIIYWLWQIVVSGYCKKNPDLDGGGKAQSRTAQNFLYFEKKFTTKSTEHNDRFATAIMFRVQTFDHVVETIHGLVNPPLFAFVYGPKFRRKEE